MEGIEDNSKDEQHTSRVTAGQRGYTLFVLPLIRLRTNFLVYAMMRKNSLNREYLKIFQACGNKDIIHFNDNEIAMIKALLKHGADVNVTGLDHTRVFDREEADSRRLDRPCSTSVSLQRSLCCKRQTDPIQIAARSGCANVLELLLSFGAKLNKYDFPNSPLHIALSHGHTECAKLIIQHGPYVDFTQILKLAVDQQEPKYVRCLIVSYKKVMMEDMKITSYIDDILLRSVRKGNLEIIGMVLDLGANINDAVGSHKCPLAESNNGEVAKFLIDRGANVNRVICIRHNESHLPLINVVVSHSPLIKVLINRDTTDDSVIEVIQVLLENGASANSRCWNGKTALMLAVAEEGNLRVIQLLLSHGARLCERDREGNTALIHVVLKGCSQNVTFLLQSIKDRNELLNVQNDEELTALMCAVRLGDESIVRELVDQGADVNIKDSNGNTVLLHLLLSRPCESRDELLRCVIHAGCDVNGQNNEGLSPLMVAARNSLKDICLLIDSGAEVNAVNKHDKRKTALSYLIHTSYPKWDFFLSLDYLLDEGASSSYVNATDFHKIISASSEAHIIPKLIRHGLGPVSVTSRDMYLLDAVDNIASSHSIHSINHQEKKVYSPLHTALCFGNSWVARFFVRNLFLTPSDVFLLGHDKMLRQHLETLKYNKCLDILNEITAQPMTLFNLSFVAVLTAVGTSPGREVRVRKLELPQIIKDKLLFKT